MHGIVFVTLLCYISQMVYAGDSLPEVPFVIRQLKNPIRLDGIPDEKDWQDEQSLSFFVLDPVWGAPAAEKTEMRFLYDDKHLYVAGKCFYKDPSKIIVRNFIRDGWRGDDWVAVHIDSRFDHQTAINFAMYPGGSRYDMLISNDAVELGGSPTNPSYNGVWEGRSAITTEGWFFEMKIPLFNLRYKINPDGTVRMALSVTRWTAYNNEMQHSVRIPQGVAYGFHKPSLKQEVGFEKMKKHKLFLVTPYAAASATHRNVYDENLKENLSHQSNRLTAGLDAKIGLNQRLTLDATINPDFGQAEADLQQINLSRFGLYLPERRLFFQEQSGLFDLGLGDKTQLFYSRRIGLSEDGVIPLYGGLRVTGQLSNKTDIGLLNMQSVSKNFSDSVHAPSENYGVFRFRNKVFNDKSFIGVLFTNRISRVASNYALGTDAVISLFRNNYLKLSIAATYTKDSATTGFVNFASSRLSIAWQNVNQKGFVPQFGYTYSGKNFDPQLGFLDRTDFHNLQGTLAYGIFAKTQKQIFSQQNFSINASAYINAGSGKTETVNSGAQWKAHSVKGTSFTLNALYNYEYLIEPLEFGNDIVITGGKYHFPAVSFLMVPLPAKKISFPLGIGAGGFFDGQKYFISLGLNFNSAKKIQIQPGYDYTHLAFSKNSSNRSTHVHIARLNIIYAPDLHFSAMANIQFNSLEQKLFSNIRLRYNFSDGHDIYLVWNNDSHTSRYLYGIKSPLTEYQQLLLKYFYTFKSGNSGRVR